MTSLRVGPLVRAISTTSVVIWAEFSEPCTVICSARPDADAATQSDPVTLKLHTTTVGRRFFVASQLNSLLPATWYTYHLATTADKTQQAVRHTTAMQYYFRTLDAPATLNPVAPAPAPQAAPLRIAYGSCRRSNLPETDALNALGPWLLAHRAEKERLWPHLLLLIGDQVYADQAPDELLQTHPHLEHGASTFDDFALLYEYAWTHDAGTRQALALLPTYMIFDDHEVTNNWNTAPDWRAKALQAGHEAMLIDGQLAYWVYQGWGNLDQRNSKHTPLLTIMQEAAQSGEDAIAALRTSIKADVYGKETLRWHYEIPSHPPIFVTNTRTERTALLNAAGVSIPDRKDNRYNPTRIISQEQMADIQIWLRAHERMPTILVSSVPVLLPPLIGLAEYVMGQRLWLKGSGPLRKIGEKLASIQQKIAAHMSFDHWPLYSISWHELIKVLTRQARSSIILSGDVHFSYAIKGKRPFSSSKSPRLYQFVSTPLQNVLESDSQRKVELQAHLSQGLYGGLYTHMLPLNTVQNKATIHTNILFQNTIALLTVHSLSNTTYKVQNDYLGIVDKNLEVIGQTLLAHDEL